MEVSVKSIKLLFLKNPLLRGYVVRVCAPGIHMVMDVRIKNYRYRIIHSIECESDVFKIIRRNRKTNKTDVYCPKNLVMENCPAAFFPLMRAAKPFETLSNFVVQTIEYVREVSREKTFEKDDPLIWIHHMFADPFDHRIEDEKKFREAYPIPSYKIVDQISDKKSK